MAALKPSLGPVSRLALGAALWTGISLAPCAAQSVDKDEIIRRLSPPPVPALTRSLAPAAAPALTRRIEIVPGQQEQALADTQSLPAINIRVLFDYNSDVLTAEGKAALKPLGEALKDPKLKDFRVLIGGHTDARGSEDYNILLSDRRARSVREHLVLDYGIAPERLSAMGFGKRKPADPADPEAAINRRVEIVNLGR